MKRSLLINIALALVVASIAAWMILRPGEESTATRSISQKKAADATRIAIERNGLPGFVLEKDKAGNWIQSAPFPARTDASKAPRLLDLLGARAKTTFPATDLGRFDLDQPFARMTIDDQVFAFGTVNAITNEQYVLAGDTVFLVSPIHGFALPTQVDSLASHLLLAEDEIPTAFSLPGVTIELRDGKWLRKPPASDPEKHSQDDFVRWTEQWRYASSLATRVPTTKPVGESVRITLQNGRTIEMRILSRSPELRHPPERRVQRPGPHQTID